MIVSYVKVPMVTKDPKEAVHQTLEILRRGSVTLDNIKISIFLIAGAYPEILLRVAKVLPAEADIFSCEGYLTALPFLS